jgi:hypothetical protein
VQSYVCQCRAKPASYFHEPPSNQTTTACSQAIGNPDYFVVAISAVSFITLDDERDLSMAGRELAGKRRARL